METCLYLDKAAFQKVNCTSARLSTEHKPQNYIFIPDRNAKTGSKLVLSLHATLQSSHT